MFQQCHTEGWEYHVVTIGAIPPYGSAQEQKMRAGVSVPPDQTITTDTLGIGQYSANRDNRQLAERGDTVVSKLQQISGHLYEIDR